MLDDGAFLTTKGNHGGYCEIKRVKDIRNTREVVAALGGLEVDLVMGGPPCHDLSGANLEREPQARGARESLGGRRVPRHRLPEHSLPRRHQRRGREAQAQP